VDYWSCCWTQYKQHPHPHPTLKVVDVDVEEDLLHNLSGDDDYYYYYWSSHRCLCYGEHLHSIPVHLSERYYGESDDLLVAAGAAEMEREQVIQLEGILLLQTDASVEWVWCLVMDVVVVAVGAAGSAVAVDDEADSVVAAEITITCLHDGVDFD
jgi:hypothetical protein